MQQKGAGERRHGFLLFLNNQAALDSHRLIYQYPSDRIYNDRIRLLSGLLSSNPKCFLRQVIVNRLLECRYRVMLQSFWNDYCESLFSNLECQSFTSVS